MTSRTPCASSIGSVFHSLQATSQALQPMHTEVSVKKPDPRRVVGVVAGLAAHVGQRPEQPVGRIVARECRARRAHRRHDASLPSRLYRVILSFMKTAISVPDDTFERVEKQVAELGISRSEFFARAAKRYLDELEGESITAQINAAIAAGAVDKDLERDVTEHGRRMILELTADDEW